MDFVKWIRKNNRKIMVFVVIFSMVSFVIGSYGIQIIVGLLGGGNQLVAEYDGHKIKTRDFLQAQNELKVLQMLMADRLLMSQRAGLSGPLLVHLLFRDSQLAGDLASQFKQAVQQGQLPLSLEQIENYFSQRPERPEILWLLLKAETYDAGFVMSADGARMTLQGVVPQLTGNQIDAAGLVSQIISSTNLSEQQILRIFADLMSIVSYAGNLMNNQAVSTGQVRADIARSQERIDADFVRLNASEFVDPNATVADADLQKQFDTYKGVMPGSFSRENPFGFGYKLPKRVQLEYLIVPLDELKKLIDKPSDEAVEDYYSRNIQQYQSEIPTDPNNPESPKITQTKSFAEVETSIRRTVEEDKIKTLAAQIFLEARELTEKGFETINFDEATAEQLQMAAGDYQAAAKQLREKYKISVFTDKTGLLGPEQFADRSILNALSMQQQQTYLPLSELAFAVTQEKPERQRIGLPAIRVWENIGPFGGGFFAQETSTYKRLMALVRVTDIQPSQVPESLDLSYDIRGIRVFDEQPKEATTFSLKEQVKEDVLLAAAMNTVKSRAEELAQFAKEQSWDTAVKAYNEKHAAQPVVLDSLKQQQRLSLSDKAMVERFIQENPSAGKRMQMQLTNGMLTNQLYELLPSDAESTGTIQQVLTFEPHAASYVVKQITRKPATITDYLENKAMTALQLNGQESAALAITHFDTANILKRMNYKMKTEDAEELEGKVRPEENVVPSGEIL